MAGSRLPGGTVTFLFTDIEGSTRLIEDLGEEGYVDALAEQRRLVRSTFSAQGGVEVDTQGDAFLYAFADPGAALTAAAQAQEALAGGPVKVRMGVHTGEPRLTGEGYAGRELHRAARIAASGHGGQVVVSAATRALVEGELTELGEHRLKDFSEPVALFQLGGERFPPLKTISNTNLPRPASSFIGRQRERDKLVSMLTDGARLVTLSGPGGSGKTRLAIEAASELVPTFKAGVFWVGLSALREPALVVEEIARTLGAKETLAAHIGERELLLLLDNFEQVVEAAPELSQLLEACPNLRLLVTSRELLRIRGEVEYPVPALAEPEAVELFCQRAQLGSDETIAELCHRLDDMPLALELAAARTRVLSPAQILDRLAQRLDLLMGGRDADPRQQTLRATIAWSHDLLDADEKRLFARLAVFSGGCTLEAAEEVVDADVETLASLVDKSVLRHTRERYWMLETIGQYAQEQLAESDEASELQRRHARYFLALAEEAEPEIRSDSLEWLERLEAEHDNLRSALDRFEISGETQLQLRLAGALSRFWYQKDHLAEGRRRLESALRADDSPTNARAQALNGAAVMAINLGDPASARLRGEEALALHRKLGNAWGAAYAGLGVGLAAAQAGDEAWAAPLLEESVRLFHELGDEQYTMVATHNLAWVVADLGDRERARRLHEDTLRRARKLANRRLAASSLAQLSGLARDDGRLDDAMAMMKEALRVFRDLGHLGEVALNLVRFARLLALEGEGRTAVQLLSSSEALHENIGANPPWWVEEHKEQALAIVREQLDENDFAEAWERGRTLSVNDAVALALEAPG